MVAVEYSHLQQSYTRKIRTINRVFSENIPAAISNLDSGCGKSARRSTCNGPKILPETLESEIEK